MRVAHPLVYHTNMYSSVTFDRALFLPTQPALLRNPALTSDANRATRSRVKTTAETTKADVAVATTPITTTRWAILPTTSSATARVVACLLPSSPKVAVCPTPTLLRPTDLRPQSTLCQAHPTCLPPTCRCKHLLSITTRLPWRRSTNKYSTP